MYGEEKIFCTGPTRAAKADQKSLVPARQTQRTNQGRNPVICSLWVPIPLSFNSQQGQPLSSTSGYTIGTLAVMAVKTTENKIHWPSRCLRLWLRVTTSAFDSSSTDFSKVAGMQKGTTTFLRSFSIKRSGNYSFIFCHGRVTAINFVTVKIQRVLLKRKKMHCFCPPLLQYN